MGYQIDLNKLRIMQWCMFGTLIVESAVTFSTFDFLMIFSYLVLGSCFLFLMFFSIVYAHRPQLTRFDLLTVVFFILLVAISTVKDASVKEALFRTVEVFLFLMLVNFYRNDLSTMLKACCVAFSLCTYANLVVMVLFPSWALSTGSAIHGFLLGGNYNQLGARFLCAIITNILCLKLSKKWWYNLVPLTFVSILTLAIVGSKTSLSCISLFLLITIFFSKSIKIKRLIAGAYFAFYILFQCFVVFSGKGLQDNALAVYIIEDVLKKDLTFTQRTDLWDMASRLFSESPFIGYGYVDRDWYLINLSPNAIGPHNFIYSILLHGGLLLLCVFIAMFLTTYSNYRQNITHTTTILMLGIDSLLFMQTMEVYPTFFIIYLMILVNYYPYISKLWKETQSTQPVQSVEPQE